MTTRTKPNLSFTEQAQQERIVSALENVDILIYHALDRNESLSQTRQHLEKSLHSIPQNIQTSTSKAKEPVRSSATLIGSSDRVAKKDAIFKPTPSKRNVSERAPSTAIKEELSFSHSPPRPGSATGAGPSSSTSRTVDRKQKGRVIPTSSTSSSSSEGEEDDQDGDIIMGGTSIGLTSTVQNRRPSVIPVASRRRIRVRHSSGSERGTPGRSTSGSAMRRVSGGGRR